MHVYVLWLCIVVLFMRVMCLYVVKLYPVISVLHSRSAARDEGDVTGGHFMQVQVKPRLGSYIARVDEGPVRLEVSALEV